MNEEQKYIELHRQYHNSDELRMCGRLNKVHVRKIGALIQSTNSKTLLDFGCGKGMQYTDKKVHENWNVDMPVLYDPAISEFAEMPVDTFDGVICTDVMEHIPECAIDESLDNVMSRAEKFVYFHISTRPAFATLLNGENSHVTIREHDWWIDKIQNLKTKHDYSCMLLVSTKKGFKDNSIAQDIIR